MQQNIHCVKAISTLQAHFRMSGDVLVAGEGYLIVSRASVQDWGQHFYPDCVVAFGVEPKSITDRNGYVISEVGKTAGIRSGDSVEDDRATRRDGQA